MFEFYCPFQKFMFPKKRNKQYTHKEKKNQEAIAKDLSNTSDKIISFQGYLINWYCKDDVESHNKVTKTRFISIRKSIFSHDLVILLHVCLMFVINCVTCIWYFSYTTHSYFHFYLIQNNVLVLVTANLNNVLNPRRCVHIK